MTHKRRGLYSFRCTMRNWKIFCYKFSANQSPEEKENILSGSELWNCFDFAPRNRTAHASFSLPFSLISNDEPICKISKSSFF